MSDSVFEEELNNVLSSFTQFMTFCNPTDWSTPGFPVHRQLPGVAQTHIHKLVMSSNHLILCLLLFLLPSIFPSIRVFSNELILCIRLPKYWSFSFSISPAFCHKGSIICISEVTDISPGKVDSSLYFIQPDISHDVLCI